MHVRLDIAGSTFHTGRYLVTFLNSAGQYAAIHAAGYTPTAIGDCWLACNAAPFSAVLDPACNTSVEVKLPMWAKFGALPLVAASGSSLMGSGLNWWSYKAFPLVNLGSSNGTPEDVSITFWVWMSDAELLCPTYNTTLPTGLEGQKGPVSTIASAVGSIASVLKRVPVLRPFATAVQEGSRIAGDIAALFGLSRPPVITPPEPMIQQYFAPLSTTSGADSVRKMTMDPLQGLSLSPAIAGMDSDCDMMMYHNIASRFGFLGSFNWDNTQAVDTVLCKFPVCPALTSSRGSTATVPVSSMTPLAHLALAHTYWRGSLVYRVDIAANAMMRGRLLICWHEGNSTDDTYQTPVVTSAANQQLVMDITENMTLDFTVAYDSLYPALLVATAAFDQCQSTLPTTAKLAIGNNASQAINGFVTISILTKLQSQVLPTTVTSIVSIRGGGDFELYLPSLSLIAPWTTDLGEVPGAFIAVCGDEKTGDPCKSSVPHRFLNHRPVDLPYISTAVFGERVVSLRALLKRYCIGVSVKVPANTSPSGQLNNIIIPIDPPPLSASYYTGTTTLTNVPLYSNNSNMTYYTSFMNWFSLAYAGVRGGTRVKICFSTDATAPGTDQGNPINVAPMCYVTIFPPQFRLNANAITTNDLKWGTNDMYTVATVQPPYPRTLCTATNFTTLPQIGFTGSASEVFHMGHEGVSFEIPDTSFALFRQSAYSPQASGTQLFNNSAAYLIQEATVAWVNPTSAAAPTYLHIHWAAAEDFTFVGYLGPPNCFNFYSS